MVNSYSIDFSNSFLTWKTKENSLGRFQIEAVLKIFKDNSLVDFFYLLSGVIAGNVYGEKGLIYEPPYLFQAIFSSMEYKVYRTHALLRDDCDSYGNHTEIFQDISTTIREVKSVQVDSFKDLEKTLVNNKKLNTKIYYKNLTENIHYELEFPIKHINIHTINKKFQIETGPILIPMKYSEKDSNIDSIYISYVAFNTFTQFEYIPFIKQQINDEKKIRFYHQKETVPSQICIYNLN